MSIGLITGTFDPPTFGHLDIIERAQVVCSKLYIGVADNGLKPSPAFTKQERIELLQQLLPSFEILPIDGLVIDFAKSLGVDFLIRGLRAFSDLDHEFQMAFANRKMAGLETLFLMAEGRYAHISSSLIREIAAHGHHLKDFIPSPIEAAVTSRLQRKNLH